MSGHQPMPGAPEPPYGMNPHQMPGGHEGGMPPYGMPNQPMHGAPGGPEPPHGMPLGPVPPPGMGPQQSLPPMPAPWDPSYPQWYSMWYYSQFSPAPGPAPTPVPAPPQAPTPQGSQPSPPGFDEGGPPPPKKPSLNLTAPPPPPPEEPDEEKPEEPKDPRPQWQAAKKGAVIYNTPRPPTPPAPPKPAPILPPPALLPPPPTLREEPKPKKMQWWYDGQSWVYAFEEPAQKAPTSNLVEEFEIPEPGSEDTAGMSPMDIIKNKFAKPDKPKATPVRCEVCQITLSCQKTYETHINGKPHKKRLTQLAMAKERDDRRKEREGSASRDFTPGAPVVEMTMETLPGGIFFCKLCDCKMNSIQQAQAHVEGGKHVSKAQRGAAARRGGRAGPGNRGVGQTHPVPLMGVNPDDPNNGNTAEENNEDTAVELDPEEEYERVFAECLENNIDMEEAIARAEAAKQAALPPEIDDDEVDYEENDEGEKFPPPGVTVIQAPKGFKPGIYKCEPCTVILENEPLLQEHLTTEDHKALVRHIELTTGKKIGGGTKRKPRIYRAKPNAENTTTVKAQRGRRGLISGGEVMPAKLTKSEKKARPKDLAAVIEEAKAKAKLLASVSAAQQEANKPKINLMNFVKGGIIQND